MFICIIQIIQALRYFLLLPGVWRPSFLTTMCKMWLTPSNVLVIALFIQYSHAYSLGAPNAACKRMTPGNSQVLKNI